MSAYCVLIMGITVQCHVIEYRRSKVFPASRNITVYYVLRGNYILTLICINFLRARSDANPIRYGRCRL